MVGEPAFPNSPEMMSIVGGKGGSGMTLRDYFAAAAIPALIGRLEGIGSAADAFEYIASHSYLLADAMIAEREKRDGKG